MLCLAITGFDGDPDQVTQLLGIAPTAIARKGATSRSGRPHKCNGWWFEAHADRLTDGGQQNSALERILVHLRERADRFKALREMLKPSSITVYGGIYLRPDKQCGVWLDPDQMDVLAFCGVGWSVDLFTDNRK